MKTDGRHGRKGSISDGSRSADRRAAGELTADQLQPGKTYVEVTGVGQDLIRLLVKVVIIIVAFVALFSFVFGLIRQPDGSMAPAMHDGDLALVYHLDRDYVVGEATAVDVDGRSCVLRVVAVAGDTVDISDDGLLVNGSLVVDHALVEQTLPFEGGTAFPLTVGENQVFLLGDAREHAVDSRAFGCVDVADTQGSVIGLLRRRGV